MICQVEEPEGEFSQLSRQDSDQVWAKSMRRTRPMRIKMEAPMGASETKEGKVDECSDMYMEARRLITRSSRTYRCTTHRT